MNGTRPRQAIKDSAFWQAYNRSRYEILFYALLLTLVLMPTAAMIGLPSVLIKFLLAACLLAAVMPNGTKHSRYILLAAVGALIIARFLSDYGVLPVKSALALALGGVVGLLSAAGALRFAVTAKIVNSEVLFAALSTYLLAGLFCGQIYWAIESLWPGSLVGPDPTSELTTIYYSFVTLATLGYGDYLPRTDIARGVATFEVIGGQLFLAVMVARLIGAFGDGKAGS